MEFCRDKHSVGGHSVLQTHICSFEQPIREPLDDLLATIIIIKKHQKQELYYIVTVGCGSFLARKNVLGGFCYAYSVATGLLTNTPQ